MDIGLYESLVFDLFGPLGVQLPNYPICNFPCPLVKVNGGHTSYII